jgi:hypothetical protein
MEFGSAQAERVRPAICRRGESEFARAAAEDGHAHGRVVFGGLSRAETETPNTVRQRLLTGDWASD